MSLRVRRPEKPTRHAEDRGGAAISPGRYEFGPFTLDTAQRTLFRDDAPWHLPPRVYALAEILVTRAGEAVSKEVLLEAVWPDVLVSEQSLSEAVWQLRRALGDNPKRPEYVQTVPKFGFRFVAPVHSSPSDAGIVAAATDWRLAAAGVTLMIAAIAAYIAIRDPSAALTIGSAAVLRQLALPNGEPIRDMDARFSPDATRLLYTDFVSAETVVLDLANGNAERLADGVEPMFPYSYRWSPDADLVAVAHHRSITNSAAVDAMVEIHALGSGETTTLERGDVTVELVDWSPDGERLMWLESFGDDHWLVLVSSSGEDLRIAPVDRLRHARLSPDGRALLYVDPTGTEIRWAAIGDFVVGSPGSVSVRELLANHIVVAEGAHFRFSPVFSADGNTLLYVAWNRQSYDLRGRSLGSNGPEGRDFLVQDQIGGHAQLTDWLAGGRLLVSRGMNYRDVWVLPVDPRTGKEDGSPLLVSTLRGEAGSPAWSADPKRLLFKSRHDRRDGYLYIADLSDAFFSGAAPTLTRVPGPPALNPAWRGSRIVFASDYVGETTASNGLEADASTTFFVTDPEGGSLRVLSESIGFDNPLTPTFGPFENKLLINVNYAAQEAMDRAPGLYVVDLDTGEITPVPGSAYMRASWAGSVDLIAQKVSADINAIQVLPSDGSSEPWIILDVPEEDGRVTSWMSLSPDGRFVAYPRQFPTEDPNRFVWQLWIAATDGSGDYHVQSVDHLNPWRIAWSPDGKLIAFSSIQSGGGLWMMEQLAIEPPTR